MKWIKRKLKKWFVIGFALFIGFFYVTQLFMALMAAFAGDDGCDTVEASSDRNSGLVDEGDWTKVGSPRYKTAKAIFDYWTKERGFSGAAAAGVIGNANNESTLDPFAVEQGSPSALKYGTHYLDARDITGAVGTNGYGLFQVSPGSKLGNWEKYKVTVDEAEATKIQMDYIWHAYNGASTTNGLKNTPAKLKIAESKTPEEATWNWFYYVEFSGGTFKDYDKKKHREEVAKQAYDLFNGKNIKPNTKKLGKIVSGEVDNIESDPGSDEELDEYCAPLPEGYGIGRNYIGSEWADYDSLPNGLKKYAHNPAVLIGKRGNGKIWKEMGVSSVSEDQCVGLVVAYGNKIWGTTGNKMGNGIDQVDSWAKATGTKVGTVPKAGSIASQNGYGGNPAGHTFIVQHVFKDGSILVVEQNWSKSGQNAGEKFTWDFRVISRNDYVKDDTKFNYPGENKKFKLHWT